MPTPSPAPTANQYLSNIVGSNSNLTQDQLSGLLNNFQSNPGWSNNIDYENGGGTLDYTDPNTGTMYHYDQSGNFVGSNSASQIASWQDNSGWLSGPLGLGLGLAAAAVLAPELLPEIVGGDTAAGVALDSAGNLIPGSVLANGATVAADGSIIGADGSLLAPAGSASVSGAAAAVAPAAAAPATVAPTTTSLSDLAAATPAASSTAGLTALPDGTFTDALGNIYDANGTQISSAANNAATSLGQQQAAQTAAVPQSTTGTTLQDIAAQTPAATSADATQAANAVQQAQTTATAAASPTAGLTPVGDGTFTDSLGNVYDANGVQISSAANNAATAYGQQQTAAVAPTTQGTSLYSLANPTAATNTLATTPATDSSLYGLSSTPTTDALAANPAQGIVAPSNFGTAAYANQVPSSLVDMGGAQGITAGTTAGLAGMGGAQGIVAPTSTVLGDTSSFVNAANTAANQGLVNAAGVTPVGSTTLGDASSLVNAGTAGTVGAAAAPVTSAISPSITDGTAAGSGLLSNLSPSQLAALGSAAAQAVGGVTTANAIQSAQAQQAAAAQQAMGIQQGVYNQQLGMLAPYQQTAQTGLTGLQNNAGYFQNQFNNQDLNAQLAPNYGFMLQQGQMANQRAANVGGGALSGNTLQGLNQYTQNYAQNAYQNAFNNYQTQRNNIYNSLAGIAGLGTSANQQAISAGNTYGTNATNLTTGLAAANAAATVGLAQNTSNTLNNIANNVTLASLLGQKAG